MASPDKWLFAIILITRWLQIKGLPGDLHEQAPVALRGQFGRKTEILIPGKCLKRDILE